MFLTVAAGRPVKRRVKRDDKRFLPVDQSLLASGRHMNKSNH